MSRSCEGGGETQEVQLPVPGARWYPVEPMDVASSRSMADGLGDPCQPGDRGIASALGPGASVPLPRHFWIYHEHQFRQEDHVVGMQSYVTFALVLSSREWTSVSFHREGVSRLYRLQAPLLARGGISVGGAASYPENPRTETSVRYHDIEKWAGST